MMTVHAQNKAANGFLHWKQLASIPEADGLAGSYAGISNGAFILAGGTNFPGGKRPWTNGVKTWYDQIFVLEKPGGSWKIAGRLIRPLGYGVALTYKDGVVCLGGGDAIKNYTDAFILKYSGGKIQTEHLPQMPFPLINACGVIVHDKVYVAGGIQTPSGLAGKNFWSLDLSVSESKRKWEILPPFPGAPRMLAMAGALNGKVYIFGGVHLLVSPPDTVPQREYLKDAWQYGPGTAWKRIADLPYPLAAAPSPAYADERFSHLYLPGGDDGSNAFRNNELKDAHPGFRNEILAYNTASGSWSVAGTIPVDKKPDAETNPHGSVYAPVTTPLVIWEGKLVIAGGEARPAVRSNRVLMAEPVNK